MKKLVPAFVATGLVLGSAPWALAHHSHAMFDTSREVTINGTVTSYVFRNPHVFLYVDVKGDNGVQNWGVEMSNISNMERRGIYGSTFKVGDTVTVKVNPLKDGRAGGNYTSVTTADGKTLD
ncbi:MAG: hypothetical protein HOP16_13810 [Acidobacteria bacterium]|nr:hypothetical protein [Acidobacteriota bacterium]